MRNVIVKLYHPTIDALSDRTFKTLLKQLSRRFHQIHLQEARYLIESSQLAAREKQSLRDRIEARFQDIPNYYIDAMTRSSLGLTIALTAFGYWLLNNTLSESVKEAWKRTGMHRHLVDYLGSDRRETYLRNAITAEFPQGGQIDRFQMTAITFENHPTGDLLVNIGIETPADVEITIRPRIDVPYVIEQVQAAIAQETTEDPGSGTPQ